MAQQTDTYENLIAYIEALAVGASGVTDDELPAINTYINGRAKRAYRQSQYWENMLLVDEKRNVNANKIVTYSPSDTSLDTVDTFLRIGLKPLFDLNSEIEHDFSGESTGARLIGYRYAYDDDFTINTGSVSGTTMSVALTEDHNLLAGDQVQISGIDITSLTFDPNGEWEVATILDSKGFTVALEESNPFELWPTDENSKVGVPYVYCTYKKRLTETYGDGTGGTTSAIPEEWYEYLAYGATADFLATDGAYEKSAFMRSEAKDILDDEIAKTYDQKVAQSIGLRVATHGSTQARSSVTR